MKAQSTSRSLTSRSLLALGAISVPILLSGPVTASGAAEPVPGVQFIESEGFPEGQTGPAGVSSTFTVVAASPTAKRLNVSLDGHALATHTFTADRRRARTTFELTPRAGWHRLSLTVVDAHGRSAQPRVFEFGARATPTTSTLSTGESASGVDMGGRFTEADGSPAIRVPVAIYPMHLGASDEQLPLARAITRPDGTWNVHLSSLPSRVQAWAAENGGVLNMQAIAEGVARDPQASALRNMTAVSTFSSGVASHGRLTDAARDARLSAIPTAPLLPVLRASELTHLAPVDTTATAATNEPQLSAEEREYYTPKLFDFVGVDGSRGASADPRHIGRSDFTGQAVTAPVNTKTSASSMTGVTSPSATGDQCYIEGALVTKRTNATSQYTRVIEGHAYQDATASASYSTTAGSNLTMGVSYDLGKNWGGSGSVNLSHSMGWSSGYSRGPYFAFQWRVPVRYGFYNVYKCTMINGVKKLVYRYSATHAERVAVPNGGTTGSYGSNVASYDGYYGYKDAPYKARVVGGTFFDITHDKAVSYTGGANAFGFSVTSTTTKSGSRKQGITAGRKPLGHYIFGYHPIDDYMKVFYSY